MTRTMIAIIVKEFRENLRWAGLIFLITFALLVTGLNSDAYTGRSVLNSEFLMLCGLMYPGAGLALGLLQIFQDSRRGRWQFVAHRNVSRSQWLACKVIVGVALYLVATALPLAAVTLWAAEPGHVSGPFTWDMTQPAVAYLLSGVMWYAAGLLIAARTARWMGSRIVPLGAALAGTIAWQNVVMTLPQAIAVIVACTVLILLAAWGAFVAGGETSRSPQWAKALIGLSLAFGWGGVIVIAVMLGSTVAGMLRAPIAFSYQVYVVTRDGQVEIWKSRDGTLERIQDLAGRDIAITPDDRADRTILVSSEIMLPQIFSRRQNWFGQVGSDGFLNPGNHEIYFYTASQEEHWFYVVSRRTFEGYDRVTHHFIGSLGPDGFAGTDKSPQPFLQSLQNNNGSELLPFADAVYQLDTIQREVRKVYTSAPGDPAVAAAPLMSTLDYYIVATQTSLHILQHDQAMMAVPIEYSYLKDPVYYFEVGRTTAGQFVIAYTSDYGPGTVSVYQPDGTLVRRIDLPPLPQAPVNVSVWDDIGMLSLFPPLWAAAEVEFEKQNGQPEPPHWIVIVVFFTLADTAIGLMMLRRQQVSRRQFYIWTPLFVVLGLCGILLLMSMRDEVRSVRCPSCGKRRLLRDSVCPHCGTPVAPPPMQGIEIFQTAGSQS